jgi:hypothetical protein
MANKNTYSFIYKLLHASGKRQQWMSFVGLAIGLILLFVCLQTYFNMQAALQVKSLRKNGFDFISVSKEITNANLVNSNSFTQQEIEVFKKQTFVTDVAALQSNLFRAEINAGSLLPLRTDLFVEAIDDKFLDTLPQNFKWQVGQQEVPIIFSADFLEMYNVFAPAQGLPKVSASTIGEIKLNMLCENSSGMPTKFTGRIVALSDRINSFVVPIEFLTWANKSFAPEKTPQPTRLFVKTTDANSIEFLNYVKANGYYVNKDKTKFGRYKQILQNIIAGLSLLAVLVVLLSILLFTFYIRLMISESKQNLLLLKQLGFSPKQLTATMVKKFIPMYVGVVLLALLVTQILQLLLVKNFASITVSPALHWALVLLAVLFVLFVILYSRKLVAAQLKQV